MAETITPVVHGGRRRPYLVSSALHVAGAAVAAALLGLALGAAGALARAPWEASPVVVALVGAVYLAREALALPIPLPDRKRQVPEWWRTFYSPGVAAFLYGAGLGVGFLTYLSFGTFAAVMAGAIASGDPLLGALLCLPFGLGRGLAVVVATWRGRRETIDRLDRLAESGGPRWANAGALAGVAAAALAAAL
jgi:cytochrome c biogenesis protein CcdA